MTESQQTTRRGSIIATIKGSLSDLKILLAIGGIVILYITLFPEAFWQSRELDQNRAKWESQHITHYRMSLNLPYDDYSYDQMPLTVEVKDGKVISATDARGETVSPAGTILVFSSPFDSPSAFTIPSLFSYVYKTIWEKPPEIDISYDPTLGYPKSIYIDPYTEPCCQEFSISVQDFQVLSP